MADFRDSLSVNPRSLFLASGTESRNTLSLVSVPPPVYSGYVGLAFVVVARAGASLSVKADLIKLSLD